MSRIDKRKYPHYYRFKELGGYDTIEGLGYINANFDIVSDENIERRIFEIDRKDNFGTDKDIHIPEIKQKSLLLN